MKRRKRLALYALYKKGLEEGRFESLRDAARYIATQPAPCYFVSPEYASDLVGFILAGKPLDGLNPAQKRLAARLYQEYKNYLSTHPETRRSRISILNDLVDMPAPEWYMSPEGVRKMLREELREVRKKMGW